MQPTNRNVIDRLYQALLAAIELERTVVLATLKEEEVDQATKDLIARLDVATNAIAAKIQKLIDAANAAGTATAAEIDSALSPVVTQLESMGADQSNPLPTP